MQYCSTNTLIHFINWKQKNTFDNFPQSDIYNHHLFESNIQNPRYKKHMCNLILDAWHIALAPASPAWHIISPRLVDYGRLGEGYRAKS